MIAGVFKKVNIWCREHASDLFMASIIFLIGFSSFGLGRLSVQERPHIPITITTPIAQSVSSPDSSALNSSLGQEKVVASKNGSIYHYPWCSGALRIKEENKIWFTSKEDARKAGLKPAGNCSGLSSE